MKTFNETIQNIINDLTVDNENNAYYYDALDEKGYRLYQFSDGSIRCFCKTAKGEVTISEDEFAHGVEKSFMNAIGEESYESLF